MMWDAPKNDEERTLMESFEANYERLREQSGRSLAPFVKEAARLQVLLYFRRLQDLAAQVDETEIHLVLPEQRSPEGRTYSLEGVVDIVHDDDRTTLYDLKTYLDADSANDHVEPHYRQLNVYAHIWNGLRGRPLDAIAVIATRPTRNLARALRNADAGRIEATVAAWNPILDVPVNASVVDDVIRDFGATVDAIENRCFTSPPLATLKAPARPEGRSAFAQDICINCDARFGCTSYRQFVKSQAPGKAELALREANADFGGDAEREDWRDSGLTQQPRIELDEGEHP